MPELDPMRVRRLALAKAGLLKPEWTGLPSRPGRGVRRHRAAAQRIIERFGYLQLDTVSIAGARSHALVLLSRLPGLPPDTGEELLTPGAPLFEYWGHQASWLPLDLYPVFAFRREGIRRSAWCRRILDGQRGLARDVMQRIREEGALRSADLEGEDGGGWWAHKPAKRVAVALWSAGTLAIRERSRFQRSFDLPERVIPEPVRETRVGRAEAFRILLRRALEGHGWATTGTLAATWALRNVRRDLDRGLEELVEGGEVVACRAVTLRNRRVAGWILREDLELAERLVAIRPRRDRGVLLSPFDPVLWDRRRVADFFGFDQVLEIFKPASDRRFGYFCLPVLAGEQLVGRVDLKADRGRGVLDVLTRRFESSGDAEAGDPGDGRAMTAALDRYADALQLRQV